PRPAAAPQAQTLPLAVFHPPATPATPAAKAPAPKPAGAPVTLERATQMASNGNALAATVIGLRYLDGTGGTPANPAQAAKWLGQAADKGQPVAQYRFATLLERGQGVTADPARAVHFYLAAANQGNRKAMHNLAVAYAEGIGGKKDMAEA